MYKIWVLEREDGGIDHFMNERAALKALNKQPEYGPYKATSVPKQGYSEHAEFEFVVPTD